jgi:hypothetical protein
MTILRALLLAANALAAAPLPQATIPRVESMIRLIKDNKRLPGKFPRTYYREKNFSFTEQEVNDYLTHWIDTDAKKIKEISVKSGSVHLLPGHLLEVDVAAQLQPAALEGLKGAPDSLLNRTLRGCLSMNNTVHARVFLTSAKGKMFFRVQDVRLKEVPFPDSWVETILRLVSQNQHPPLDFNKLFDLPNGIEKIEIQPQQLQIHVEPFAGPR